MKQSQFSRGVVAALVITLISIVATGCFKKSQNDKPRKGVVAPNPDKPCSGMVDPEALKKWVSVSVETTPAKLNQPATTRIVWKPASGFKWNKEYPVNIELVQSSGLKIGKRNFTRTDMQASEKSATLRVPFTPAKKGSIAVEACARISVCNDNVCKIIPEQLVSWTVTVN
ncbi:MAG: hypothetical protein KC609_18755 [Myxococcales bacterium]|nr:hypothetical protein [Myxococcales bacterium]